MREGDVGSLESCGPTRRQIPSLARVRPFVAVLLAALFLFAETEACLAQAFGEVTAQSGTSSPSGVAGALRLRVRLDGRGDKPIRPEVSLSLATEWQDHTWSPYAARLRYAPSLEVGLALGGDPVLRVGSIDLRHRGAARSNAQAESGNPDDDEGGVPNWVWWTLAGATAVTLALVLVNNCHYHLDDIGYGKQASC